MYSRSILEESITNWNHENAAQTKNVFISVKMEMLDEKEQAEIKKALGDFINRLSEIVPENPPAPGQRLVYG